MFIKGNGQVIKNKMMPVSKSGGGGGGKRLPFLRGHF